MTQSGRQPTLAQETLHPHDLFVLNSTNKIVFQKLFQIGSWPCPTPCTILTYCEVDVRVEIESCEVFLAFDVASIL